MTIGTGSKRACLRGILYGIAATAVASGLLAVEARASDGASLYLDSLDQPLEDVRYGDAMIDCAARMLASREIACDLVPAEKEVQHSFWVWRNEGGAFINRTLDGNYRLREEECLDGFCRWQGCRITAWPTFACDDGSTRTGSVQDRVRLILDEIAYERVRQE
ncbi:hypothetical protein [Oricola sp.]|uniref:hypothetical protein n=1 Tax=Oricola sp. TaxID=1979950 RepID=UPI0025F945AE|nr:hypothetical protein [Oricola sp.]MCI5073812.1 hypothetical protein [Oricola sp.]